MDILKPFESILILLAKLFIFASLSFGFIATIYGMDIFRVETGKNILIALCFAGCIFIVLSLMLYGARKMLNKMADEQASDSIIPDTNQDS